MIEKHARGDASKPLMLYLAYPAPHTPWLPSPEFRGKSMAGLYGDFLMMVDAMIGRVLGALDKAKMSKDTLLVFSSDNGPVWYEADQKRLSHSSVGPLRGMKADAWEGGHRMPFIVRWPGKVAPNSVSAQTICFTDMMATLASIVGVKLPPEAGPDSFDFSPVLLGEQAADKPIRGTIVIPAGGGVMSVRSGPWKLITGLGSGGFSPPRRVPPTSGGPTGQLYHLDDDIGETRNLFLEKPEVVARLQAELRRIREAGRSRP